MKKLIQKVMKFLGLKKKATLDELIKKTIQLLLKHLGKQKIPFYAALDIPGTKNEADFYINKSLTKEGLVFLQVGVRRVGYDLLVSHYHESMTEDELREYLAKIVEDTTEIQAEIKELSDNIDDREGEFPGYN